ncbi:hypothetical protein OROGR_010668 [Orobanche gracilis]
MVTAVKGSEASTRLEQGRCGGDDIEMSCVVGRRVEDDMKTAATSEASTRSEQGRCSGDDIEMSCAVERWVEDGSNWLRGGLTLFSCRS